MVQHSGGISQFEQKISLELNMVLDEKTKTYQQKNTEILAVIQFEGKVKSGGNVKYNAAQIVNHNLKNKKQTIQLNQCPDPNAFIEITFDYEIFGENFDDTMSIMNMSSMTGNDISVVDFGDDKISTEIVRINSTIEKFNGLVGKVQRKIKENKEKERGAQNEDDDDGKIRKEYEEKDLKLRMAIEKLEGSKNVLEKKLLKVTEEKDKISMQMKLQKGRLEKELETLKAEMVEKGAKQRGGQNDDGNDEENYSSDQNEKENQRGKNPSDRQYREMYEKAQKELIELKANNKLKSMQANSGSNNKSASKDSANMQKIKQKNEQLQSDLADMSYKLATLFNSAFEYGGADLLDKLQTSIGLTEND